jgi:hypothetical protein
MTNYVRQITGNGFHCQEERMAFLFKAIVPADDKVKLETTECFCMVMELPKGAFDSMWIDLAKARNAMEVIVGKTVADAEKVCGYPGIKLEPVTYDEYLKMAEEGKVNDPFDKDFLSKANPQQETK